MATLNAATVAVNFVAGTADYSNSIQKALNATAGFEKSLQKQIDTFGMSRDEAKLYALSQRGVSEETLKTARSLMEQKKALEANAASMARGRQVAESVITPQERYRNTVGELSGLLRKGHIDQTTYARAMANARNEMIQSSTAFQGLTGGLSGVLAATGPIGIAVGVVAGAVMALAASSVAAGIALFNLGKQGADYVDGLKDQAENLGLTLRGLEALRFAAERNGSSVGAVESAVEKMNKSLGEAVTKGGDAEEAFSRIGLNANQLASMAPDQAFKQIADAIKGIKNPYEQAYVAQQIFGKGAQQIMGLLRGGSAAIDDATKKVEEYGRALSSEDAKAIEQARDAWNDIRKIVEGIGIQLAVTFAPAMKALAEEAKSFLAMFGGIKNAVRMARDAIVLMGASVEAAMNPLQAEGIFRAANELINKLRTLDGKRDELARLQAENSKGDNTSVNVDRAEAAAARQKDVAKTLQGLQEQARAAVMSKEAMVMLDLATKGATAEQMKQAAALMETVRLQEQKARNDKIISDLQFQAETFGMNAKQIAIYKMALDGATVAQMEETAALYDKLDAMQKQKTLMEEGKRLTESLRTDEEKRADELARYQELLRSGAITQETYNRAVDKMNERVAGKATESQEVQGIAAREIRFNASIPGAKRFTDELKAPAKETAKNTEEMAAAIKQGNDLLKDRLSFEVVEIL